MTLSVQRITTPQEALTLAECKRAASVDEDVTDWDELFRSWLKSAILKCEHDTGRQLCTATWEWRFSEWPSGRILEVPRPPLISITSVQYYDADNAQQTLSADDYSVDVGSTPGRIVLDSDASWPELYDRWDAVLVTWSAGYGTREDVPAELRTAMRMLVAHWFKLREATITGTIVAQTPYGPDLVFEQYAVKKRVGV